jgi:hypothetical protein
MFFVRTEEETGWVTLEAEAGVMCLQAKKHLAGVRKDGTLEPIVGTQAQLTP